MRFFPEGVNPALTARFNSIYEIKAAIKSKDIYEGTVRLCDSAHNLYVDIGAFTGIIPRVEGALGILEGTLREVALLSRVGKKVCFRIIGFRENEEGRLVPVLSRRAAQLMCQKAYLDTLVPGDIITAKVTRLEGFGAFIDIGCGLSSLIPIDMLSVSRIRHPSDRVSRGEVIRTVLKSRGAGKLTFSLKELLGTWEENAALFSVGDTVTGTVRSIEGYGAFVELTPNLAGLTDMTAGLNEGARAAVFIKSINPEKMKVKLSVVEPLGTAPTPAPLRYFVKDKHIDRWDYSPAGCTKNIVSLF